MLTCCDLANSLIKVQHIHDLCFNRLWFLFLFQLDRGIVEPRNTEVLHDRGSFSRESE